MDRRGFLKTVPTAAVFSAALGKSAAADVLDERKGEASPLFDQTEIASEAYRFVAAIFPSESWGVCAQNVHFHKGCLADAGCDFPHESLIDIHDGQFAVDADKGPHLAIAVANPHDRKSWRAAQTQCAALKRAGTELTLLFAAHPYPEYRYSFDPRTLTYEPEGGWLEGADVVINFVTMNLREEFPRMVYALTHFDGGMPCMDVIDICMALKGGNRAVYFCDTAYGTRRAARASRYACNQLSRSSLARYGFNGGLVLMEANTWGVDELYEIHDSFKQALPHGTWPFTGRVGHYDCDPWLTVHAIVTYAPT